MARIAVTLRGPPGAGKTTVANELRKHFPDSQIVSLDKYWGKGEMRFQSCCRYSDLCNGS